MGSQIEVDLFLFTSGSTHRDYKGQFSLHNKMEECDICFCSDLTHQENSLGSPAKTRYLCERGIS